MLRSHFTIDGVVGQIRAFLDGGGDLRCQRITACPTSDCEYTGVYQYDTVNTFLGAAPLFAPHPGPEAMNCTRAHAMARGEMPPMLERPMATCPPETYFPQIFNASSGYGRPHE